MYTRNEFQGHEVCVLQSETSTIRIAPDRGARLLTWQSQGQELLYWPEEADWSALHLVRGGNPVLFPFIARHKVDGVLGKWKDEEETVREMPMHGFARESRFEVVDTMEDGWFLMRLTANDWTRSLYPFDFVFEMGYRLEGSTLDCLFRVENRGNQPMPYYTGHHFYFAVPHLQRADWSLDLPSQKWGRQQMDGSMLFTDPESDAIFTLDDKALIDRMHLHSHFEKVRLKNQSGTFDIELDLHKTTVPWYAVTTWTLEETSDFYCVEPWLGLPNAIHHKHGLRWLEPGQREEAVLKIRDLSRLNDFS